MTLSCILKRSISLYQHRVRSTELLMSPLDNREYVLTFSKKRHKQPVEFWSKLKTSYTRKTK
jgi:hypothetical protein